MCHTTGTLPPDKGKTERANKTMATNVLGNSVYPAKSMFAGATCTSKAVFLLLVTKNRSLVSFPNLFKNSIYLNSFTELQISKKEYPTHSNRLLSFVSFVY